MKTNFLFFMIIVASMFFFGCGDSKPTSIGPESASKADTAPKDIQESGRKPEDEANAKRIALQKQLLAELEGTYHLAGFGCQQELDSHDLSSFMRTLSNNLNYFSRGDSAGFERGMEALETEAKDIVLRAERESEAATTYETTAKTHMDGSSDREERNNLRRSYFNAVELARKKSAAYQFTKKNMDHRTKLFSEIRQSPAQYVAAQVMNAIDVEPGTKNWLSIAYQISYCKLQETFSILDIGKVDGVYHLRLEGYDADQSCQDLGFQGTHHELVYGRKVELTYDSVTGVWTDSDPTRTLLFCGEGGQIRKISSRKKGPV